MKGKVKKIFHDRGYGFISDTFDGDIFFHCSALRGIDFKSLEEGMNVEYETDMGSKGILAENIRIDNPIISINKIVVTSNAKVKFKEVLQNQANYPEYLLRITVSSSNPGLLELVLDTEREGDLVINSDTGTKILLIGTDIIPELEGKIIDYRETPHNRGFVVENKV